MNKCIQKTKISKWMTKGKTTVIQKDHLKGTAPNNYRPITCLPMMWKIQTAKIREIYNSLISRRIFSEEQKGWRKRNRGTEELLCIDQYILIDSRKRRKNLVMAWIDYKMTYDMIPKSSILHCLKRYRIPDQVIQFIEKTMEIWIVESTIGRKSFA